MQLAPTPTIVPPMTAFAGASNLYGAAIEKLTSTVELP